VNFGTLSRGEWFSQIPPLSDFSSPSIQGILPRMPHVMNILLSVSSERSSSFSY